MRDEGGGRTWGGAGSRERGGGTSASSSSPLPGRERSAQGVRAPSTGAVGSTQEVTASSTGGHEPPQGVEVDRWAAALRGALRGVLAADEVDIGPALTVDGDPEPGTLALATDDWALTVEGLTDVAAADPPCLPPQAPKDILPPSTSTWETANMILSAQAIAEAALLREESRGAHFRSDHPDTEPTLEGRHLVHDGRDGWRFATLADALAAAQPAEAR